MGRIEVNTNGSVPLASGTTPGTVQATERTKLQNLLDIRSLGSYLSLAANQLSVVIANATTTVAGLMSDADKSKLDGVQTGATASGNFQENLLSGTTTLTGTGGEFISLTLGAGTYLVFGWATFGHATAADIKADIYIRQQGGAVFSPRPEGHAHSSSRLGFLQTQTRIVLTASTVIQVGLASDQQSPVVKGTNNVTGGIGASGIQAIRLA